MSPRLAVYAGSFDPVTLGHVDLMQRAARLFDRVVVAVGVHPTRAPLFSVDERLGMLRGAATSLPNIEVTSFGGLLIDFCKDVGAHILIRGLRHSMDFEYELQIAQANADMAPDVETVFLPTASKFGFVTASLIREIASHGGNVSRYVPANVVPALTAKFQR
ncbi:MAG: pantetheine-phosphate adenylyltransferase [Deltaproteobacteria bacterium]|nr:pantetheine-phosphate adenylyltransferase [Deltaproteobacteria bacterium]